MTMEETNLLFTMMMLLFVLLLLWQFFCLSGTLLDCRLVVQMRSCVGCVDGSFVWNEDRSPSAASITLVTAPPGVS